MQEEKSNTIFPDIFSTAPDFINEEGVKWWKDVDLTNYARNEDKFGTRLDAYCFFVELPSGEKNRVLLMGGRVAYDDQSMEGIAVKIDMLKLLKRDEGGEVKRRRGIGPTPRPLKRGSR